MLSDYRKFEFFKQLSNAFNVHVRDIDVGKDAIGDEITVVMIDEKTDPAVIATLPKKFANERVEYKPAKAEDFKVPGCGQTGHVCACGANAPKP